MTRKRGGRKRQRRQGGGSPFIGFAWYQPEQWAQLRAVSADVDELEDTYEEWSSVADQRVRELEAAGVVVEKIMVDIPELVEWCKSEGS